MIDQFITHLAWLFLVITTAIMMMRSQTQRRAVQASPSFNRALFVQRKPKANAPAITWVLCVCWLLVYYTYR